MAIDPMSGGGCSEPEPQSRGTASGRGWRPRGPVSHGARSVVVGAACALLVACSGSAGSGPSSGPSSGPIEAPEEPSERAAPPVAATVSPQAAMFEGDSPLPGVGRVDDTVTSKLRQALAAKPADYEPRTHHLDDEGRPTYVNRLILETSPYLLQHAHNPVNWYPWGDDAFERAKREHKPVLLSIGYSTCHWCHVMERESFEDEEIAAYLNAHYIAIKVDREERPDIDDIYMKAVQMLTGRGGWPMTTVLTADRRPFFGGTYFPARDGDRGARKGFLTILAELKAEYDSNPDEVVRRAAQISQGIRAASEPAPPGDVPGAEAIVAAARSLAQSYDTVWGGFGRAPKFPTPTNLELLLRYHRRAGDEQARTMVLHTLQKMAAGGMYDQVGGGFHRYSTDARWLAPHFEKMLYDNAQLVAVYLDAYQVTGDEDLARVARQTLDYVSREMTSEGGGFYSATDADSPVPGKQHEEEGWFFTWTPAEIHAAAGPELAPLVIAAYGATERGNFEGRNILHVPRPLTETAASLDMKLEELREALDRARQRLYQARLSRPAPIKDEKIIASWNGLMISAFARGALVLNRDDYARTAARAADFVLSTMRTQHGRLHRTSKDGQARHPAVLDDYAFLIQGLLDLYDATSAPRWLREALRLQAELDRSYADTNAGGYFMTGDQHEALLARDKPAYDGAEPSGNAVALLNLLRLHELTGDEAYRRSAERGFAAFSTSLTRGGRGATKMLSALDFYLDRPLEVVIVTPGPTADAGPLLDQVRRTYLPNRILTVTAAGGELDERAALIPLLQGKLAIGGKATAFVCEKGRCEQPTSTPEVLRQQLAKVKPLQPNGGAR